MFFFSKVFRPNESDFDVAKTAGELLLRTESLESTLKKATSARNLALRGLQIFWFSELGEVGENQ